jgi:hypothetical protein
MPCRPPPIILEALKGSSLSANDKAADGGIVKTVARAARSHREPGPLAGTQSETFVGARGGTARSRFSFCLEGEER